MGAMVIIDQKRSQWYSDRDVFFATESLCRSCFSNLSRNYKWRSAYLSSSIFFPKLFKTKPSVLALPPPSAFLGIDRKRCVPISSECSAGAVSAFFLWRCVEWEWLFPLLMAGRRTLLPLISYTLRG